MFQPAQVAFEEAFNTFKKSTSRKNARALEGTSLRDVLDVVVAAQRRYEDQHTSSKTQRYFTEFSKRIGHYGKVMDVLVQHHPEYVSLAWGAMKMVFGVRNRCLYERNVTGTH